MATRHFTRLCAVLSRIVFFCRFLRSVLRFSALLGRRINISSFPNFYGFGSSDRPGFYFVDSVVFHHCGDVELGLVNADQEHIGYYAVGDIVIK